MTVLPRGQRAAHHGTGFRTTDGPRPFRRSGHGGGRAAQDSGLVSFLVMLLFPVRLQLTDLMPRS